MSTRCRLCRVAFTSVDCVEWLSYVDCVELDTEPTFMISDDHGVFLFIDGVRDVRCAGGAVQVV